MSSYDLRGVTMPPPTRQNDVHPQAAFHQKQYNEEETDQYHEDYALAKKVALMILVCFFFVVLLLMGS